MGRLSEYDHVEREALRKGISRQPDPLPRGAVVAGKQQEVVERRLKESSLARVGELEDAVAEMGARLERVREVVGAATAWRELDAVPGCERIEDAAEALTPIAAAVDALTPEEREWAEGEES